MQTQQQTVYCSPRPALDEQRTCRPIICDFGSVMGLNYSVEKNASALRFRLLTHQPAYKCCFLRNYVKKVFFFINFIFYISI